MTKINLVQTRYVHQLDIVFTTRWFTQVARRGIVWHEWTGRYEMTMHPLGPFVEVRSWRWPWT